MSNLFSRPYLPYLLSALLAIALSGAARAQSLEAPSPAPVQSTANLWTAPHFSVDPQTLYKAASAVPAPEGTNVAEFVDDDSFTFDE